MLNVKCLAAAACIGLFAAPLLAQDAALDSRITELRAMSKDDRQAALRAMAPEERRGLWFQLKQAERAEKGRASTADGFYRDAIAQGTNSRADGTIQYDAGRAGAGSRAVGTIQYDNGVGSTTFGGGAIIGNRFDTHTGGVNVTASGTVDTVIAVVAQGPAFSSSSAGFVLLGPQTASGGAFAIFSTFTAGLTGTTQTVTFPGMSANYTGSSFFVLFGDFASSYVPVFGTGTNNGQGHHGVVGYTGGMGPNITGTFNFGGSLNSLVRATGNILPVELMDYGVN
jgi:hypothetical protein